MADFTEEELETLEQLARIRLKKAEREELTQHLKNMLDYVATLQECDTEKLEACSHVIAGTTAPLREDVVHDKIPREEFLENAPAHAGGLLKVPPVIQDEL